MYSRDSLSPHLVPLIFFLNFNIIIILFRNAIYKISANEILRCASYFIIGAWNVEYGVLFVIVHKNI